MKSQFCIGLCVCVDSVNSSHAKSTALVFATANPSTWIPAGVRTQPRKRAFVQFCNVVIDEAKIGIN